jgi:hypothetical protein
MSAHSSGAPIGRGGKRSWGRVHRLAWEHGVSVDFIRDLHDRAGGRCEICDVQLPIGKACLDHCHQTGEIRGVLCHRCNVALGWFNDSTRNLMSAYLYLSAHGGGST